MIILSKRKIIGTIFIVIILMLIFLFFIKKKYMDTTETFLPFEKKTVILDAGHGFPDERGSWK